MKKALIYLFLPLILFNSSVFELLKTPALVSHFITHRNLNHIDVLQFLSMHYLGNDIGDDDEAEDSKLPFKRMASAHTIHFNVPLSQPGFTLDRPAYSIVTLNTFPLTCALCNPALDDFFKPPQA